MTSGRVVAVRGIDLKFKPSSVNSGIDMSIDGLSGSAGVSDGFQDQAKGLPRPCL